MFKVLRILAAIFFPVFICVLTAAWWLSDYLDTPLQLPEGETVFLLTPGMGLSSAADRAAAQGWLAYPAALKIYARIRPELANIRAGEYRLVRGSSIRQWLEQMQRGEVLSYQLTLVEGWTLAQALASLDKAEKLEAGALQADETLWLDLGIAPPPSALPEGWFFPDTYQYHRGDSTAALLNRAYQRMVEILNEEWQQRPPDLPYETRYDALIMASIIEKETGVASERGQIAGVFVRRLQKNMRLQTDPTVIYGMGQAYRGNLRGSDLRNALNPYNTYQHKGLPPSPIALPGREAIHAALHPEPGEALYFVARGDGSHQFSKTLEEHQAAVRKYQVLKRRQDYRSSPGSRR